MSQISLAVISDYPEENWYSMNLCTEMLTKYLRSQHSKSFQTTQICPDFRWRFKLIPGLGKKQAAFNGDRLLNRFWDYPQYLKKRLGDFDLFHVGDHSYAQLVHVLPPERTGVFCHDIDAFRSLLEPSQEPRPAWYKAMSRRILDGLQKAAVVFYTTAEIRKQIEYYNLLDPSRLVQAPLGISPEFSLLAENTSSLDLEILNRVGEAPFLLHVGSCIPRKRIDVLLEVFAEVKKQYPELRLVKVSGDWTNEQQEQINQLNIAKSIIYLKGLERSSIAALYRKASLVLLTSEAEGFGLPIIEALACGAIVIASHIPVLQEVGGDAAVYCPVGDISVWLEKVAQCLANSNNAPAINTRLAQAEKYSWSAHANTIAEAYLKLR